MADTTAAAEPLLRLENLDVYYGAIHALRGVSVTVAPGEIVTLIGANGAGKSTLLRAASGLVRARSGRVVFAGQDVTRLGASGIVGRGLVHCPEGRRIFANMTVRENLELGAYLRRDRDEIARDMEHALTLSRACASGSGRAREPFPAANSRCSPWDGPC